MVVSGELGLGLPTTNNCQMTSRKDPEFMLENKNKSVKINEK